MKLNIRDLRALEWVANGCEYSLQVAEQSNGLIKRSAVWLTMARLEEFGLIERRLEEPSTLLKWRGDQSPQRKYHITEAGKNKLNALRTMQEARGGCTP